MKMKLFQTNSSNNVIGKILTDEIEVDIKFKDTTDIENPLVVFRSKDNEFIKSNYAYIEKFNKYYFIERMELYPNNIYNLFLKCDVLETYKKEILACQGYVKQQKNSNPYFEGDYKYEIRKEVDIYKSEVILSDSSSTILTTIGG